MPLPKMPESPTEEVVNKINQVGLDAYVRQVREAGRVVTKSTVCRWLKRNGYKSRPQYVKVGQS